MRTIKIASTTPAIVKPVKATKRVAKPAPIVAAATNTKATDKHIARADRAAVLNAHRDTVSAFYATASLTVHKAKAASLDTYVSRVTTPVQRVATGGGTTERDHSMLVLLHNNSKAGVFDPVALACDAGVLSRLASVAFVSYDAKAQAFSLTAAGTERAKLVIRKAA